MAIHPEYVNPLREEIEGIVATDGWTNSALMKMVKLDSFLKESIRIHPISSGTLFSSLMAVSSLRLALTPYTFSNGITIKKGTFVGVPIWPIHMDESIYENAQTFDGFRFSKLREKFKANPKFNASSTSVDYLQFGHGPHAWYVLSLTEMMLVRVDSLHSLNSS